MLKLYNTLTRKKEVFTPAIKKTASVYSCGPTVYNYAHIGNLRTYIFTDILRRALEFSGLATNTCMNITDVGHLLSDRDTGEDKMAIAAKREKKTPLEIAEYYTGVFFADLEKLNIKKANSTPKATEYIQEMIMFVVGLLEKGVAYKTSDGIYFDISKFAEYGKLSRLKLDEQKAGARVAINSEKRNPQDFALWKNAEPNHIMQWDSPWGKGYPGWHIECSAMAKAFFGTSLDIHTGGVDHIPIHHENEIAQSEALEGCRTVNFWLHSAFMLVNGGKMSKSLGNVYTVSDLEKKGYSATDFRYFCLNAHYRKELNFTFKGLDAAKVSLERLATLLLKHKASLDKANAAVLKKFEADFRNFIFDDLNIPAALGLLWTMLKQNASIDIYRLALKFDKVFGLNLDKIKAEEKKDEKVPKEIIALAERRLQAKKDKDFALADKLRGEIQEAGYNLVDTVGGYDFRA